MRLSQRLVFLLGVLSVLTVQAELSKAEISYISDYQQDQQLLIDAKINLQLSAEMQEALKHEVPIRFKTTISLSEKLPILGLEFYQENTSIEYETELRYFGYTNTFILTNHRTKKSITFKDLNNALYTLGVIYSFPITELAKLHPGNAYQIKMRMQISPWHLPAPLIVPAIFSDDWQLDTDWQSIEIHTPQSWY